MNKREAAEGLLWHVTHPQPTRNNSLLGPDPLLLLTGPLIMLQTKHQSDTCRCGLSAVRKCKYAFNSNIYHQTVAETSSVHFYRRINSTEHGSGWKNGEKYIYFWVYMKIKQEKRRNRVLKDTWRLNISLAVIPVSYRFKWGLFLGRPALKQNRNPVAGCNCCGFRPDSCFKKQQTAHAAADGRTFFFSSPPAAANKRPSPFRAVCLKVQHSQWATG